MLKNKIILGTSLISLFGGYFIYDYTARFHSNYAIMAVIAVMAIALSIFSFSNEGKRFWNFFGDVKKEFKKIYFPKLPEVIEGLAVVFVFCAVAMSVIWFLDGVFLNLYNSLMN
tara:strand:- start:61237 stop:61578 length:342 start_codon:yes stop_codon:yes gene_type:complete